MKKEISASISSVPLKTYRRGGGETLENLKKINLKMFIVELELLRKSRKTPDALVKVTWRRIRTN
jgi:hypothetical protein